MNDAEIACKWITEKVKEGRYGLEFSQTDYDGSIGVFIAGGNENETALGTGDTCEDAVLDAISRSAEQKIGTERETCTKCNGHPGGYEMYYEEKCSQCSGSGHVQNPVRLRYLLSLSG